MVFEILMKYQGDRRGRGEGEGVKGKTPPFSFPSVAIVSSTPPRSRRPALHRRPTSYYLFIVSLSFFPRLGYRVLSEMEALAAAMDLKVKSRELYLLSKSALKSHCSCEKRNGVERLERILYALGVVACGATVLICMLVGWCVLLSDV